MANGIVTLSGNAAVRGDYNPTPSSLAIGSGLVQYNTDTALGGGGVSAQYLNTSIINLSSPGLWLLMGQVDEAALGSESATAVAISQYTGNTTTDHVTGVNVLHMGHVAAAVGCVSLFYLLYLSASDTKTTVYLKTATTGAVGDKITGSLIAWKLREV